MTDRIEDIDKVGQALRARRVRFQSGTERVTAAAAVRHLGLEPGMRLSSDELESSLAKIEPELARERALRLLGYRERSRAELAGRLTDDGFPDKVVGAVGDALEGSGLLDDARFAEHLVRTRSAAGYGARRILQELMRSGIDRESALAFIEATETGNSETERLRAMVSAHPPRDARERDRLVRRLVAKGFSAGAVIDAIAGVDDADYGLPDDVRLP